MTDKMRDLKYIQRDLILWNNKYNDGGYLDMTIMPEDDRTVILTMNGKWNGVEPRESITNYCDIDHLINE